MIDTYLNYLHEGRLNDIKKHQDAVINIINTKPYIWLYHGTYPGRFEEIKKNGLLANKHGSGFTAGLGDERLHSTRKKHISYTSYKRYSRAYTGKTTLSSPSSDPLLVRVPTEGLERASKNSSDLFKADEFASTRNIPPKDIIFPDDPQYKKIEADNNYLVSTMKLWSLY